MAFEASISTSTTYLEINDPEHCGILALLAVDAAWCFPGGYFSSGFQLQLIFLVAALLGVDMFFLFVHKTAPHSQLSPRKSNGKLQATMVACQFQDIRCSVLTQILISLEQFNVSKPTAAI